VSRRRAQEAVLPAAGKGPAPPALHKDTGARARCKATHLVKHQRLVAAGLVDKRPRADDCVAQARRPLGRGTGGRGKCNRERRAGGG
jgi:hypothetical protein